MSVVEEQDKWKFFMVTSMASILSGLASKFICHPLDTLKAKLQVDVAAIKLDSFTKKHSLINTATETVRNEGIRGLYKGLGIATIGSIPAVSLYFTSYEVCKAYLDNIQWFKERTAMNHLTSGFVAEIVACTLFVPIDVIKERLQVQSNLKTYAYKDTMHAIHEIKRSEGIRGLYRAYGATIFSFGPFSALYFALYENFKQRLVKPNKDITFMESLTLAGVSGAIAGTITNPLDMAKLRMQVQRAEGAGRQISMAEGRFGYKNMVHGVYCIYTKEGPLALFKGSLARILYHTPATAISMSALEVIRGRLLKSFNVRKQ